MLHDGRFVDAWGRLDARKMLRIACHCSASRFTDIFVGAGDMVGSGARVMVDDAIEV